MDGNYVSQRRDVLAMSAASISEMLFCSAGEFPEQVREKEGGQKEKLINSKTTFCMSMNFQEEPIFLLNRGLSRGKLGLISSSRVICSLEHQSLLPKRTN